MTDNDLEPYRRLACAVIEQALADLGSTIPEDHDSAAQLLFIDLWKPDSLWGQFVTLNKKEAIAGFARIQAKASGIRERRRREAFNAL